MEKLKYIVIPKAINGLENFSDHLTDLKKMMNSDDTIFQNIDDGIQYHNKRLQLVLPYDKQDDSIKSLSNCAKQIMDKLFSTKKCSLVQSSVSILYSENYCMEQDMHYDYNPVAPYVNQCYASILFLEDNSSLILQVGDKKIEQQFNQGDIIIFRADKAHADSKRDSNDNIRLQYYFNHPLFKPTEEKPYLKNGFDEVVKQFNSISQRIVRHKEKAIKVKHKRLKGIRQTIKNRMNKNN